jgi:glycosyltransferase involved in cell wall biosynthesis
VPNPKPAVFRITKTNHNILQGVPKPEDRFTKEDQQLVDDFGTANAERSWTKDGCPLAPRSKGGADLIVVDDPQMPVLVSIAKEMDPERPVIFRSHIQMRSELIRDTNSQAHAVWQWIWSHAQKADVFVAHPISKFVPDGVPEEKVAYMPATTDWIDGLNKQLSDETTRFYLHEFNSLCRNERSPTLSYPKREYIVQVARFDPSKGLDDCLAAYAEFRRTSEYCKGKPTEQTPQLVLCGHSSVDDPDGTAVFNDILAQLEDSYSDLKDSVIVMRLGPSDQMLNTLLSCSRVALQLSTSEGFEVKVSEALHKGIPVIARDIGGLPLQIQHGKSGYLVRGDSKEDEIRQTAEHIETLFADTDGYEKMKAYAKGHISDEVGTVGNAVCWMYLADRLTSGEGLEPAGRWVWDMAREQAGEKVPEDEVKLPRNLTT